MICVKFYNDDSFKDILEFCKTESKTSHPAADNMWTENWKKSPHTLPYILANSNQFSNYNGKFYILYDDDKIIGCSGIYISDFSPNVAIAGVRTWLNRSYRTKRYVYDYLLSAHRAWAIIQGLDVIALTFNDYNKNLIQLFSRNRLLNSQPDNHLFYKNYNELEFQITIRGVPQWVIYENLTDNLFDWSSLM